MTPCPPKRGFTLLELMIVIVIIGILSVIGFVGYGSIRHSQDQRNTKATLEIARSMYNAFVAGAQAGGNNVTAESAGGVATSFYLKLAPSQWYFNTAAYSAGTPPQVIDFNSLRAAPGTSDYAKTIDFYNVPLREPQQPPPNGAPVPMNVPLNQLLGPDGTDDVSIANDWLPPTASAAFADRWPVYNTMLTIRRLRSSPEAKAMWSTLHPSQIKHLGAANSGQDMILDAWGRPILFVPGSGLRGVRYGTGALSGTPSYVQVGGLTGSMSDQALRSPDGHAFWVSAGPDGRYDTQDDNIYSYDN